MTILRRCSFALSAVAVAALAFLALRPSPFIDRVPWIPHWLGHWADHHGVLRNTVAFFAVGLFIFAALGRHWAYLLALAVFATALEIAQRWIPGRIYDSKDIAASLVGLTFAWVLVHAARRLVARRQ